MNNDYFLRQDKKPIPKISWRYTMSGYESLIWIRDEERRELVCSADAIRDDFVDGQELSANERAACSDVSLIIGTERW